MAAAASDDDVGTFFGASSAAALKPSFWTADDLSMGRAMVHHYQCHTLPVLHDRQEQDAERNAIPQLVHFIWLGNKAIPLNQNDDGSGENDCIQSWRRHHPKWMVQVWKDDDISSKNWYNSAALQHAMRQGNYGMASDILRLELLWEHGGLYADIDYLCVEAIDDLHNKPFDFYCGASHTGAVEVNNGLMAAHPQHPLVRAMMERIKKWFEAFMEQSQPFDLMAAFLDPSSRSTLKQVVALTHLDVIRNTGPGLVTTTLAQALIEPSMGAAMSRVAILPFQVFHPLPNTFRGQNSDGLQEQMLEEHIVRGQTKAVHLWQCSWK